MLYGFLGQKFGKVHRYDVASPLEAVRAMSVTIKGFKQALIDGGSYRILLGGKEELDIDQTAFPTSQKETIRFVPFVQGSGGFGKILLGAALIGLSVAFPYAPAIMGVSLSSMASSIGFSLVLGGVSQMLFKPPKPAATAEEAVNAPSFMFNGAVNTSRQGNAVPVCFGRMRVGSQVISAGLSTEAI